MVYQEYKKLQYILFYYYRKCQEQLKENVQMMTCLKVINLFYRVFNSILIICYKINKANCGLKSVILFIGPTIILKINFRKFYIECCIVFEKYNFIN